MLQGIAVRLGKKDSDVRKAAIRALQGRTDLIEEILERIAVRLGDDNSNVRTAAIDVLKRSYRYNFSLVDLLPS